eukprot:scaffold13972_cov39-Phaeocystis_antarctica.AAC.1
METLARPFLGFHLWFSFRAIRAQKNRCTALLPAFEWVSPSAGAQRRPLSTASRCFARIALERPSSRSGLP